MKYHGVDTAMSAYREQLAGQSTQGEFAPMTASMREYPDRE
jgi:hypothetical protein